MATAAMLHLLEACQKGVTQEIRNILRTAPALPALFVEERLTQQNLCLRALLVQLAGEAATVHTREIGKAQEEALLAAACAMELLHLGVFAHEQVVDGSGIARRFSTRSQPLGPLDQILVGDFLQAKALALLSAHSPSPAILRVFSDLVSQLTTEKFLLREDLVREAWTEKVYLERVYAKSAVLLASCCKLGALVAAGPPETIEALTSYGYALGMATQIHLDSQVSEQAQAAWASPASPPVTLLRALAESYCQKAKACLSALPASLTKYWLLRLPEQLLVESGEPICVE